MTDDGHSPTIPDTQAPTHGGARASLRGAPAAPDARYEMRELLGRGGMGEVWLAHDARVNREVAIKVMRGDGTHDDDAVARFLREACVQGQLEHPAIVPVHDVGLGDSPFFVMKRLAGTTLADVLAAQAKGDRDALERWPRRTLLARLVDVCLAIELAHRRGVIHRDLKPANIMLGDLGETYVLDWGLARVAGAADRGALGTSDVSPPAPSSGGQTVAGAILGTPGYMSPEQMRGDSIDHRTDIFALGCILHEILLGGVPAIPRDNTMEATLTAESHRPSRTRPDADVPPELDDACARATTAAPADRLDSARALADDVQRFLDGDRDLARRRELAAEHARSAVERFTRDGDAGRATAMSDAGRALALDPTNADAQQLLARLLLESPREMPPEAARKIAAEREQTTRQVLRRGALAYVVNLCLMPAAMLLGLQFGWPLVVLGTLLVALIALCYAGSRSGRLGGGVVAAVVILHAVLLACCGLFLDALTFAPIFAFGSLPIMLMIPAVRLPRVAVASHLLAIAVPIALELTGVVRSTFHIEGSTLTIHPWALDVPASAFVIILLVTMTMQMFVNGAIFTGQRAAQERAQEQLHVHSWHLAQLVPATRSRTR
ncbi:MAG: serine/threonine-protein kinase [Acidobacteriota bacterium]